MRHIAYITSLLLLLVCSCSDDFLPVTPSLNLPDGTPFEMVVGTEFPEMNFGPSTRAFSDQLDESSLRALNVNILVFDAAGMMLQFIPPSDISIERIDPDEQRVYFRVRNIYSSSQQRRLHFVATSAPDLRQLSGGEYITAMASENTVMPALVTENETDAYWGVSEVPEITQQTHLQVKLLRNFAKLTVKSSVSPEKFKLLGYTVANRPGKGTVAPFIYTNHSFASFLSPSGELMPYEDVVAQGYSGVNPAGSEAAMTHTTAADLEPSLADSERRLAAGEEDTPYYIYEHSQSAADGAIADVAVSYLIILGEYSGQRYYYKVDIGKDKQTNFDFYDLLRNFHYEIEITDVGGPGAPSLQDAIRGAAHNNISTSVTMRDLFAISYRENKIEVSATRVIFTEKTNEYVLRFSYTTPAEGTYNEPFKPEELKVYDIDNETKVYDMSGLEGGATKAVDLGGYVVESAVLSEDTELSNNNVKWYKLTITTKDVPASAYRLEQNLRIYYAGGTVNLGRTITLMLRKPWDFTNVSDTETGTTQESGFNVTFSLPAGLSPTQFPLTITFESDKQNIYPLKGTKLHVNTGKSGFPGGSSDPVILYEWRIDWSEYQVLIDPDKPDNSGKYIYTAQFKTNTFSTSDLEYDTYSIDNAGIEDRISNYKTQNFCIRIANKGRKYFNPAYVNVTRIQDL